MIALVLVVKVTVVLVAALLVGRLCARCSASIRHLAYVSALAGVLTLSAATWLVPPVTVPVHALPPAAQAMWSSYVAEGSPTQARAAPASIRAGAPSIARTIVLLAWIAGAAACLMRLLKGSYELRGFSRSASFWSEGQALVNTLSEGILRRANIIVVCHADAPGPMAFGVWHPTLVLPAQAPTWPDETLRRTILHELEHIRRFDTITQFAAQIACALYWFHPLVWHAWRMSRLEAERACDDAVVRSEDPVEYASLLVAMAAAHRHQPAVDAGLTMARPADVTARVTAILDRRQARVPLRVGWAAAALTAAAILSTFTAVVTPGATETAIAPTRGAGVQVRRTAGVTLLPVVSACKQSLPAPVAQPPARTLPVLLFIEICFDGIPNLPGEVLFRHIHLSRFVSRPSAGEWTIFGEDLEQVIQEDLERLRLDRNVDDARAEMNEYVFPNGVVGKTIAYHIREFDRR
jgi:beta-lactamase regulating signal transducer with metallopeptidase domain